MTDYAALAEELRVISQNVDYDITILSNASALIFDSLDDLNWCGFYLYRNDRLLLGPFHGKIACTAIDLGKGVCGTAAKRGETVLVKDVHCFDGHIACDSASNSEIVVPVFTGSKLYGVLDIDSPLLARFDESDKAGLELAVKVLEELLSSVSENGSDTL